MENVKLNFAHICENAFISQDGKISIIGIFERIISMGWPAVHPKFTVVTNIRGVPKKYIETIKIISPQNEKIAEIEHEIEIKEEMAGANLIVNFINIIFPIEGKYIIRILIDDDIIDESNYLILKSK